MARVTACYARPAGEVWLGPPPTPRRPLLVGAPLSPLPAPRPEDLARLAAHAVALVREIPGDDAHIGLGSGRAAEAFVRALAAEAKRGLEVRSVPTSRATATLAASLGLALTDLPGDPLDLTVDGADEVDPRLDLIKGYGGALARERIVAAASRRQIILVTDEKLVPRLGTRGRLPIEICRSGGPVCERRLGRPRVPASPPRDGGRAVRHRQRQLDPRLRDPGRGGRRGARPRHPPGRRRRRHGLLPRHRGTSPGGAGRDRPGPETRRGLGRRRLKGRPVRTVPSDEPFHGGHLDGARVHRPRPHGHEHGDPPGAGRPSRGRLQPEPGEGARGGGTRRGRRVVHRRPGRAARGDRGPSG